MNTSTLKTAAKPPGAAAASAAAPRMTMKNVTKGVVEMPHRILIYGAEKCGKSTFAAGAPNPIFLGKDDGTEHLDVARMPPPRTWKETLEGLQAIIAEEHDYKTLVVDPVNWIEPMLHDEIVGDGSKGESIEAYDNGYGRGYDAAIVKWRVFISMLARAWKQRQMHVILVAHAKLTNFKDPKGPTFQRWGLAMANDRISDVFRQWVETILFVQREAYGKVDPKTKRVNAAGSAALVAHTQWAPAYDAGNRWDLPPEVPLGWNEYIEAVEAGKARQSNLRPEIESMLAELGDADLEKKVREYLSHPQSSMVETWNKLSSKVGEKREREAAGAPTTTSTNETEEGEKAA